MAFQALLSCLQYVRQRPTSAGLLILASLLISVIGTVQASTWIRVYDPIKITVETVSVKDHELTIQASSDAPKSCIRQSMHLLYRDDAEDQRTYVPIGSSLNGEPFPGSVSHYRLVLQVPRSLHGDWIYMDRAYFTCAPWGLVRGTFLTSPPITIHLGNDQTETDAITDWTNG